MGKPTHANETPSGPEMIEALNEDILLEEFWATQTNEGPGSEMYRAVLVKATPEATNVTEVTMLVGWEGRKATENEAATLMLTWEMAGVFNPGDFGIGGCNAVWCRHAPVFTVMPQTPTFPEGFTLGRVRGLAAEEAMWAEFVYTAKNISIATPLFGTQELLDLRENVEMLAEYGFEITLMKYALKSHMRSRREEVTKMLAATDPRKKEELMMEKLNLEQQKGELMVRMEEVDRQLYSFDEVSSTNQRMHEELERLEKVLAE